MSRSMPAPPLVLRFPITLEGFERAAESLRAHLDALGVDGTPRFHVELAFEEIATNIVRHSGATGEATATIAVSDNLIEMRFDDDGVPYDPRDRPDPTPPSSPEDAQVGGLGIMLVRRMSSRLDYERTPSGLNRLTVTIAR